MNRSRRGRLVLALLLLSAFTLITLDYRSGRVSRVRGGVDRVLGPIENAVGSVVGPVGGALSNLTHLGSTSSQITKLRTENAALRERILLLSQQGQRGHELDQLLKLADAGQYTIVPAQVVAIGSALGFEWTVTIDAGASDGLRPDMTVLNGSGLVGRVKSVTADSATVLLAIDPLVKVGARMAGSNEIGVVAGQGLRPLTLTLLDSSARMRPGDQIVTFGSTPSGRPYVPGVPIGRVISVPATPGALTQTALIAPYVDFTALDLVGVVVVPPRVNPRDRVLPTPPADATPTPRRH